MDGGTTYIRLRTPEALDDPTRLITIRVPSDAHTGQPRSAAQEGGNYFDLGTELGRSFRGSRAEVGRIRNVTENVGGGQYAVMGNLEGALRWRFFGHTPETTGRLVPPDMAPLPSRYGTQGPQPPPATADPNQPRMLGVLPPHAAAGPPPDAVPFRGVAGKGGVSTEEHERALASLTGVQRTFLDALQAAERAGVGGTPLRLYNDVIYRGRTSAITERDLSGEEREELRRLVESHVARTGRRSGRFDHSDYAAALGGSRDHPDLAAIRGRPDLSQVLGGFQYSVGDDGRISITDTYDFNRARGDAWDDSRLVQFLSAFLEPRALAAGIGRRIRPDDGRGIPVQITLGRKSQDRLPSEPPPMRPGDDAPAGDPAGRLRSLDRFFADMGIDTRMH
jgi:hypothetical protein